MPDDRFFFEDPPTVKRWSWPWPLRSRRDAAGVTGDRRILKAGDTAQLVSATWPEPRAIMISGDYEAPAAFGANSVGAWTLKWSIERTEVRSEKFLTDTGVKWSRCVLARNVQLTFANEGISKGTPGEFTARAIAVPASASVKAADLLLANAPLVSAPIAAAMRSIPVNVAAVSFTDPDPLRRGLTIVNRSPAGSNLFISLGDVAPTLLIYTVKLVPDAYWEAPFDFRGNIIGIWDAADAAGAAIVTDIF